ncbi:diaminopimelate epimerase [bacterium]|nr:diaminopimelate epimerase [bacterium]
MTNKFYKWEGLGNDFIILCAEPDENSSKLAKKVCNRHLGVGGDGLIYLFLRQGLLHMEIFNSDGTIANMCGNGIRCLAGEAHRLGLLNLRERTAVMTRSGLRYVTVEDSDPYKVTVDMGRAKIAVQHDKCVKVDVGNPHLVIFLDSEDELNSFTLMREGEILDKLEPGGINVEFAYPADKNIIKVRVWERGAGETKACGTGACAVTAAANYLNLCNERVDVQLPGGILSINLEDEHIFMCGSANLVFEGEFYE